MTVADPGIALQGAIVAATKASTDVAAIADDRVFDHVPADAVYPFVQVGEIQTIDDGSDCIDGVEIYATLHVWSQARGKVEASRLAAAVRAAAVREDLELGADFVLVDIVHQDTRVFEDADGLSTHAVITLRALVDPAN